MRIIHRWLPLLAAMLVVAGCGESDLTADEPPLETTTLTSPGAYGVGITDVELVDNSRETPSNGSYPGSPVRRLPARIWYPTDPGSTSMQPASDGPFPLIGYGHGFFSSRLEAQVVAPHLASHGYILISVEFPLSNGGAPGGATIGDMAMQPGDLAFAMTQVENGVGGAALAAAVDRDHRGIAGLSLGGGTVLIAAYHPLWHIDRIQAAVTYAPASCFFGPGLFTRSLPMLMLSGDRDLLVHLDDGPGRVFALAEPPISLVTLHGGNHVGFIGIENLDGNGDDVGCVVIGSGGSSATAGVERLQQTLLQGATPDVVGDPQLCTATCTTHEPQTMRYARQQEITRAATLAHFEANLRGSRAAQRWLDEVLPLNNDLTFESRR